MTKKRSARSHFRDAAWVVIGVSLGSFVFEQLGWFDRFETAGLDAFSVLQATRDPNDVVIVAINNDDYLAKFAATSPLDCGQLKEILTAIAAGGPIAIGVDLDTSATTRASVGARADERPFECLENLPPEWPPIVWAQDATWAPKGRTFAPTPVLSGGPLRSGDRTGLAQLPQDSDHVIRRYYRQLRLQDGGLGATLPWAVLESACGLKCKSCCAATAATPPPEEALRLNFAGERYAFDPLSATKVLEIGGDPTATEGWRKNGPLTNKIVLLGGIYRPAQDTQPTPVGPMNGVKILAQAIESELHGGGINRLNGVIAVALDLAAGFLLVWVNYRLRDRLLLALSVSLLLVPFLCLAGSLAAFSTLALWFNFVPVVASVLVHQLYEHAREYQRLRRRKR